VNPKLEDSLLSLSQPSVIRVLIVEDFQPFREFVRSTLESRPELQVIGEAFDGPEAVQKATELKPDLILMDIGLPTMRKPEANYSLLWTPLSAESSLFSSSQANQNFTDQLEVQSRSGM